MPRKEVFEVSAFAKIKPPAPSRLHGLFWLFFFDGFLSQCSAGGKNQRPSAAGRGGSPWRNLDSCFPTWSAVYYYFYKWSRDGTIENLNVCLNEIERERQGKEPTPSLTSTDSQSIKIAPMIFEDKGIDGNKKINGRKRQVMVDTLGLVWAAVVHAAGSGKPLRHQNGGLPAG